MLSIAAACTICAASLPDKIWLIKNIKGGNDDKADTYFSENRTRHDSPPSLIMTIEFLWTVYSLANSSAYNKLESLR